MYIHGGRDLKEGPIASLWRVNLSAIQRMKSNPTSPVSWELISSSGRDIGKISHHTCALVSAKEVVFFGGLKGEDSSKSAFILNLLNNSWSNVVLKVSLSQLLLLQSTIENLPRDDHASFDFKDGTFLTFGGFVNGSRTGQVIKFKQEGATLNASLLEPSSEASPCFRASLSTGVLENKMFIFGG